MVESSKLLGLVVPDVRNPFYVDIARAAEERAARAGLHVVLLDSHARVDLEAQHLEALEAQVVRGVLVAPVLEVPGALQRFRTAGVPAVLLDRAATSGFSAVAVDDERGGRLAAAHLLERGRRRLLYIAGPSGTPSMRDRLSGARAAVREIDGARLHVLPVGGLTVPNGVRAGRDLLGFGRRPDGVLTANDLLALGVLQSLAVPGAPRVPDDLSLVGYDDIDLAAAAVVPITSVHRPRGEMGTAAVELLLAEADGAAPGRTVVLRPELVVRTSSSVA